MSFGEVGSVSAYVVVEFSGSVEGTFIVVVVGLLFPLLVISVLGGEDVPSVTPLVVVCELGDESPAAPAAIVGSSGPVPLALPPADGAAAVEVA